MEEEDLWLGKTDSYVKSLLVYPIYDDGTWIFY
jgi:hypothetical protein